MSDLIQIIYASQPFGYDEATLATILLDARRCNTRDGITGALVCRHDIYLQMLEGPEAAVKAAYERIGRDDRHAEVVELLCEPVKERVFGEWAMLHDSAKSWIWTQNEVSDGVLNRASKDEIRRVFETLAERV